MSRLGKQVWFLALLCLLLGAAACDDSESGDDRSASGDDDDDDDNDNNDNDDDDNDDDDNNDDNNDNDDDDNDNNDDDDNDAATPLFVRPDLPFNVYHPAATHNTYIWRGLQGILTEATSMGYVGALMKEQVFMEIDVNETTTDGDFLINHGGLTNSIRLSSIFRNIRWWSDTRPGHPPIVLGFEWNVETTETEMAALRALLDEFLIASSPLTADGPLYSYDDWLTERLAALEPAAREYVASLTPRDAVRGAGYPTVRELRGKVLLECNSALFAQQPAFFLMGGDGQIDNHSEDSLDDIALISANRAAQRLTRMYTTTIVTGANFDLLLALYNGVSNSALNHQLTTPQSPAVYPFLDEHWPGFAPDATVLTVDDIPARLGPPVCVTGLAPATAATYAFDVYFAEEMTLPDAPLFFFSLAVYGDAVTVAAPEAVKLVESQADGFFGAFAAPVDLGSVRLEVTVAGAVNGYELYLTGPALAGMVPAEENPAGAPTFWTSPKFDLIDLAPTGRCSALGPAGQRLFGEWDGLSCTAGENPSYMIEVAD